ncbi:hypothetical protein ColTof4_05460 [Colletotrichum tofieldiae]|nr:hypothetical protein ColTof3_10285 [Colletotrichum tofieldiae]GKT73037.1 hypothetical protein ColTof4_05460 [Colletotrichum tofieldiae]GKT89112.1 hypothetical protein Ct61P_06962 [Colletotrichum tofieldiae]
MAAKRLVWVKYLAVDVQPRREMTAQTQGETIDLKGPRRRPFVGAVADGFKLLCCAATLLSHARSGRPAAMGYACPVNGVRVLFHALRRLLWPRSSSLRPALRPVCESLGRVRRWHTTWALAHIPVV